MSQKALATQKQDLWQLADRLGNCRISVIGDVMLDRYLWGDVVRISPEAPVPVFRKYRTSFRPGGAANTAMNLSTLGAEVTLFGTIGVDPEA